MIGIRGGNTMNMMERSRKRHHRLQDKSEAESSESESSSLESSDEDSGNTGCAFIQSITKSNKFSLVVATMIMLNVLFMGLQANNQDFYFPRRCTLDTQNYRDALVEMIIDFKKANKTAQEKAQQLHILDVRGFPDSSFLNGKYHERSDMEHQVGGRPTFWDNAGQHYLFYCHQSQWWGISSNLTENQQGKCVRRAQTAAGVDVLVLQTGTKKSLFEGTAASTASRPSVTLLEQVNASDVKNNDFSVSAVVEDFAQQEGCTNLWTILNAAFLLFFLMELTCRLITYGIKFFTSEDKCWNIFDFTIVGVGIADFMIRQLFSGSHGSKFITMIRVVRILRILRVLRLFKEFKKLTMLIRGLLESFKIVVWICLLMVLIILVYAIFCTSLVGHNDCSDSEFTEDDKAEINMYFGSILNSTVTLFQFVTLDDWSTITRMVWQCEETRIMCPLFLIYVVSISLVVISLLTGVMAEHMNTVRVSEEKREEMEKEMKLKTLLKVFFEAFKRADKDGDHRINFEEFQVLFQVLLHDTHSQALRSHSELDLGGINPEEMFTCFDQDSDQILTWNEFKDGMEELRKPVGTKQIFKLQGAMQRIMDHRVKAHAESTPPESSQRPGGTRPRLMTDNVESKIQEVNEAMDSIDETLNNFEDDLKDFVSELRKCRRMAA